MLGDEYKQAKYISYHDKAGDTYEGAPFKVGDRVMDDNGRIGIICMLNSCRTMPDGTLEDYAVTIRFGWDSPLYGYERRVTKGEFSLVDENGNPTIDC